jgi:hypothetical protein
MPPTTPRCTSSSASSYIDQAVRPSGGLAQASASSTASPWVSSTGSATGARSLRERRFEPFLDEPMPYPFGRRAVRMQGRGDLLVDPPLIGQQEDVRSCQSSRRRLALADQPEQLVPFLGREINHPLLLGHARRPPERRRLSMPAGPRLRNSSVVDD